MVTSIAPACDKPFRPRGEQLVSNLAEIVEYGGSVTAALDRWNIKPASALRACQRAGAADLASLVRRAVNA